MTIVTPWRARALSDREEYQNPARAGFDRVVVEAPSKDVDPRMGEDVNDEFKEWNPSGG